MYIPNQRDDESHQQQPDDQLDSKDIDKEVLEAEKRLREAEAKRKKASMTKRVISEFDTIFEGRKLFYVQSVDRIFEYDRTWRGQPWIPYEVRAFCNQHPVLSSVSGRAALMQWFQQCGNYRLLRTNSFDVQPPTVLNMLQRDHWLKPLVGKPHEMYDVLTLALGGGTQEGADHLEQIMVWKYLHPEDFLIPCINWFGQGGVGKNYFVEAILGALFGREQVKSVGLDSVIGEFNEVLQGATVLLINEAMHRKMDMEKLKNMIGQPGVTINPKGISRYPADNTSLYLIASNDVMSLPVEGQHSDRCWSLIQLHHSIEHFVANKLNIPEPEAKTMWVEKFADELKEPAQISVWLNHLIEKWRGASRPMPIHGEAYARAVSLKNTMNPLSAALANLQEVKTWIPVRELFLYSIQENDFNRNTMWADYKRFCAELDTAFRQQKLPFEYHHEKRHKDKAGRWANAAVVRYDDFLGPFSCGYSWLQGV